MLMLSGSVCVYSCSCEVWDCSDCVPLGTGRLGIILGLSLNLMLKGVVLPFLSFPFLSFPFLSEAVQLVLQEEVSVLPGWGAWAGQQKEPHWIKAANQKAQRSVKKELSVSDTTSL